MTTTTTEVEVPEVGDSVTLFCETYSGGKFWAAVRNTSTVFDVEWGGAGGKKQRLTHDECKTEEQCVKKIKSLIKSKLAKGYEQF